MSSPALSTDGPTFGPAGKRPRVAATVKAPGIGSLLRPYRGEILLLTALTLIANSFSLAVPRLIGSAIDSAVAGQFSATRLITEFMTIGIAAFLFTYLQAVSQTLTSERVARDLRSRLIARIAEHDYTYIEQAGAGRLLTNLTSDVDAVKAYVAQAIAMILSSVFLIAGSGTMLLITEWRLALVVLAAVPVIGGAFFLVMSRVRKFFRLNQAAIDWLNKVINESIIGAALIRLMNSRAIEEAKFAAANREARETGYKILSYFSLLVPVMIFAGNLAMLAILALGGAMVIGGSLSLGSFAAFNTYLVTLIFPIVVIGFMSNVMAQARASFDRLSQVFDAPPTVAGGTLRRELAGDVDVENLNYAFAEHQALQSISFSVKAGTRTAIIGPTAAGKSVLFYLLAGLLKPASGCVRYDGIALDDFHPADLKRQIGIVFQDSALFNLTLRENIAFSADVSDASLHLALETAELVPLIAGLPDGLDTIVSERGTSLSGGQKQRVMLARALALNPRVLLLDDFTARVDARTEQAILANVRRNYPGLTLISITQKIAPVSDYDQILLIMEGQILGRGTHAELMASSPEYVQIFRSQQSTGNYELQA